MVYFEGKPEFDRCQSLTQEVDSPNDRYPARYRLYTATACSKHSTKWAVSDNYSIRVIGSVESTNPRVCHHRWLNLSKLPSPPHWDNPWLVATRILHVDTQELVINDWEGPPSVYNKGYVHCAMTVMIFRHFQHVYHVEISLDIRGNTPASFSESAGRLQVKWRHQFVENHFQHL
jgi:hypothetical protein